MFAINCIDHIVLKTNCIDKMIEFYCDILGCHIERKQQRLTQIRAGVNLIDLVEVDNPIDKNNQNLEHFCLCIRPFEFESLKSYFTQHNIQINRYGERYGAKGLGYSFYIKDPEGNEIELRE